MERIQSFSEDTASPLQPSRGSKTSRQRRNPSEGRNRVVIVGDNFRVGKKIGSGNFGELRLGKNLTTNEHVAIKIESSLRSLGTFLPLEYKCYRKIGNVDGFPSCHCFATIGRHNALVIELLGLNLEDLLTICGGKFSLKTVLMIAIQAITRIETVHDAGLIYRDIKPENFLIGRMSTQRDRIVHLVDFGLAKEYLSPLTGRHIPYKHHKSLTGTVRYMSLNTHMGREQSRRDDLEALGHMLIYLLKGRLPWQGLRAETLKERYQMIGEVKRATQIDALCSGIPQAFNSYMRYTRRLEFFEAPDYSRLRMMYADCLTHAGFKNDGDFDWTPKIKSKVQQEEQKQQQQPQHQSQSQPQHQSQQ